MKIFLKLIISPLITGTQTGQDGKIAGKYIRWLHDHISVYTKNVTMSLVFNYQAFWLLSYVRSILDVDIERKQATWAIWMT